MALNYFLFVILMILINNGCAQDFELGLPLKDLLTSKFSLQNSKPLKECFMAAIGDEKERAHFERQILNNSEFRGELKTMEEKEKAISKGQRKMEPNEIAELVEKHFKVMGEHKMEGEEEEKAETKVRLLLLMLFGIMPKNKHMEGKKIWEEKIWGKKWQKHLKDLIKKRQVKASNTKQLGTDNLEKVKNTTTKKTLNEFGNKVISAEWKKLGKIRKLYYGIGNFKTDQQRFYELLTECISLLTETDTSNV